MSDFTKDVAACASLVALLIMALYAVPVLETMQ